MQTRNSVYHVLTVVILLALLLGSVPVTATPALNSVEGEVKGPPPPVGARAPSEGDSHTATSSGLAIAAGDITDPSGDVADLNWLRPHPAARDMTIAGNAATLFFHEELIGTPSSIDWYAAVGDWSTYDVLDRAPNSGTERWTPGSASSTTDSTDGSLLPYEDLTYASVSGQTWLDWRWQFRGEIPAGQRDAYYYFDLNNYDYVVYLYADEVGDWQWEVDARNASFFWETTSYEDIVSASVTQLGSDQLRFEMTVVGNIPPYPSTSNGHPWFSWKLDVDNDPSTGQQPDGDDVNVVVRYESIAFDGYHEWRGVIRKWNGTQYQDFLFVPFTRSGNTMATTVDISDLDLSSVFRWRAGTSVVVNPGYAVCPSDGDFFTDADRAPDFGWVEMSLLAPSITSATLNWASLPTNGEDIGRKAIVYVRVTDPDGLADVDSVVIDLSLIGGTTKTLTESEFENGLYYGAVHTTGDVETGDKTLTIMATDKSGLTAMTDLTVKVVMLFGDINDRLENDRNSILNKQVWISAMAVEDFDPELLQSAVLFLDAMEMLFCKEPITMILHWIAAVTFHELVGITESQLLYGINPCDKDRNLLIAWDYGDEMDLISKGVPYHLKVQVGHSGFGDFDYAKILEIEEDKPSPSNPHYSLPPGYTYKYYRDVPEASTSEGSKVCTMAMISERFLNLNKAYVRLYLDSGLPAVIAQVDPDLAPNLGTLVLACGTKRVDPSSNIYDGWQTVHAYLDTTEGLGTVKVLRDWGGWRSPIDHHEWIGEPRISFQVDCPADIHIYDADGYHVGAVYDAGGNVIGFDNDIPDVDYFYGEGDTFEFASLSNPTSGDYTMVVRGTGSGIYTQTISIFDRGGFRTYTSTITSHPTVPGQEDTTIVAEIPAAPTGLSVGVEGGNALLDWDDNSESDLVGYNVYRSTQPKGVYQRLNNSPLSNSAFTDTSVEGYTIYYYFVTAEDSDHNESGHLAPVASRRLIYLPVVLRDHVPGTEPSTSPPNNPSDPLPFDGSTDQIVDMNLSWTGDDPDGDAVTYDVYFEGGDRTPDVLICNDVGSPSCDPGTLNHRTHYYWQVIARDEHGATTMGPVWEFTTQGATNLRYVAPSGLDTSNDCTNSINPCATVQYAVDVANPGDEIWVTAGTYTGVSTRNGVAQVVYISKTVTIRGGYTTADWTTSDPVANPTTLDAQRQGRVLYITGNVSPTVEGLRITGGNAEGGAGGGIYIVNATATIKDNQVLGNIARYGGGLYLYHSDSSVSENAVTANEAIYCPNVGLCWLGYGGGLYLDSSGATLANNVVINNSGARGGGLYIEASSPRLLHTTFALNYGDSGVHVTNSVADYSTVALTNTILVSHTVGMDITAGNTATLEATLWGTDTWANSIDWEGTGNIITGTNNYWDNPFFVSPDMGDYHIGADSAARDAGVNAGVTTDVDGQTRPQGPGYDIGADEYWP